MNVNAPKLTSRLFTVVHASIVQGSLQVLSTVQITVLLIVKHVDHFTAVIVMEKQSPDQHKLPVQQQQPQPQVVVVLLVSHPQPESLLKWQMSDNV